MRKVVLGVVTVAGIALSVSGLAAQTQFPLSLSTDEFSAPLVGVVQIALVQEGRSAFAPTADEAGFGFDGFARPVDYDVPASER